jgi:hypothetical protein
LSLTNPRVSHAISHAHNHINRIATVLLNFNHEYRTITKAVHHKINIVQKSGINRNIKYNRAFKTMKVTKNCGESIFSFFLISQLAKNITYANLKNSEG